MANKPHVIRGWPNGMDNVLPDYDLPVNDDDLQLSLRSLVNADILPSGRVKRRSGITQRIAGAITSLFPNGNTALAVIDGKLSQILADFTTTELATLAVARRMSYANVAGAVYYANGVDKGRVVSGEAKHWGVEYPNAAPGMVAMAGALPPGRYMSIVTYVDADGQESGCGASSSLTLSATGGIALTIPQPTQAHVVSIRLYWAAANDTVMYHADDLPVGQTTKNILLPPDTGLQLETQFMRDFLPCELLEEFNGRIYGASANILWHTQPLRYGLYKPASDYIVFTAPIRVVAAMPDGLYVVADQTYWLSGDSPENFTIKPVLQYTAAKGSLSRLPKGEEVIWYSSAGIVKASPGGQVKLVQEPFVRGAPSNEGATVYVEQQGVKKMMAAVSGEPFATGLSSADYMDAEIERARR